MQTFTSNIYDCHPSQVKGLETTLSLHKLALFVQAIPRWQKHVDAEHNCIIPDKGDAAPWWTVWCLEFAVTWFPAVKSALNDQAA